MTEQYQPPFPPPRSVIPAVQVDPAAPDDTVPEPDDQSPDVPDLADDDAPESADSEDGRAPV